MTDGGFSIWGSVFESLGARTATLSAAPTAENLRNASVYIIVDPDTEKETPKPNYVGPGDVKAVADWVKNGGVLVLMGNDGPNAELDHFNDLARVFGITFNKDSKFPVLNNDYKMGRIMMPANNPIFRTAKEIYVKEVSTLSVSKPAQTNLEVNGDNLIATSKYGKGTVFVIGDPWLYNEYTDGRRLPAEYENFKAAQDLSRWLIGQASKK